MNQEEYEEWKDDEKVGLCPFCQAPGWIVGETEWCAHYVGSDDMFGDPSSDVGYKIVEGEPFESFLERVEQLKELDEDEQEALLGKLSEESRRVLEAAVDLTDASGFWKEFVDYEELSVEVEESLCETEYHSYFVSDIAAEKASLAKRVQTALAEIRSVGGEYFEDE